MSFIPVAYAVDIGAQGQQMQAGLTEKIATMLAFFFGHLPSWIAGTIVFFLSFGVARMFKKMSENRLAEHLDEEENEGVMILVGRVTYVGTLALGITIALKIAGIDLTAILAAVAFGIGFAMRDLMMNFLAGIFILVSKPFVLGDFINIDNKTGRVEEIQSRVTILKAINGTRVIVPNSVIFTSSMVNYSANPTRRVDVPLYVAYGTDLDFAIRVALEAIKKHPKILKKPKPSVRILDWGDSSIDMKARFWVARGNSWYTIRHEMMNIVNKAFEDAGIHIPYNVLHLETNKDTETDDAAEAHLAEEKKREFEETDKQKEVAKQQVVADAIPSSAGAVAQPVENTGLASSGAIAVLAPVEATVEVTETPPSKENPSQN